MAEEITLVAKAREGHGSQLARKLRRAGHVPAVVYGHKEAVVSLTVEKDDLWRVIRHNVRVVNLQLDGKTESCLIKEIQWDSLGKDVLHVDFNRVSKDERIKVHVPVMLRGTAPGIAAGGVLNQPLHALEIECLAIAVPENIKVSVAELQIEQAIHIKDLHLPEGVTVHGDPDAIVVQVAKPAAEAAPAEGAEGPAEPEVIGRKAAEAEEGEEK
jgi:large subunit ribosomal protein L25